MGLLIIIIIGSYSYFKAREALMQRTFDQLTSLRIEKKNRIENFFQQRYNDLNNLSHLKDSKEIADLLNKDTNSEMIPNASSVFNRYLGTYLQLLGVYKQSFYFNSEGNGLLFSISDKSDNVSLIVPESFELLNRWIQDHTGPQPILMEYQTFNSSESSGVLIAQKINETDCYFILDIPVNNINHIMLENSLNNGLGKSGESYLVGSDYLMRSSSRFQDNAVFNTKAETVAVELAMQGNTGTTLINDYRNIEVLSAFCPVDIPGLEWVLLTEIDKQEAMVPIYNVRSNILYLSIILSLLVFGLAALLSTIIASPIRRLRAETEKITKGEYGNQIKIQREDEIGDLITAFNSMSVKLKENAQKLEKEKHLRISSMIDGQEMERQRLSREIHDSLGQSMLAIKLKVDQLLKQAADISDKSKNEIQQLFSSALKDIRGISKDLMPAVLNEFGLAEAIANLAAESMSASGIEFDFEESSYAAQADKKTENYLYRICQEAINNIIKHSKAERASINLASDGEYIFLTIKDNGCGMQVTNMPGSGNGLLHMKERAELLGGSFSLLSQPNNGTTIKIQIPINKHLS
jgi:signal transduction histidine kinase